MQIVLQWLEQPHLNYSDTLDSNSYNKVNLPISFLQTKIPFVISHNWSSTLNITGRMTEICTGYGNSGESINLSLSNFAYMKPTISVKGTTVLNSYSNNTPNNVYAFIIGY